ARTAGIRSGQLESVPAEDGKGILGHVAVREPEVTEALDHLERFGIAIPQRRLRQAASGPLRVEAPAVVAAHQAAVAHPARPGERSISPLVIGRPRSWARRAGPPSGSRPGALDRRTASARMRRLPGSRRARA